MGTSAFRIERCVTTPLSTTPGNREFPRASASAMNPNAIPAIVVPPQPLSLKSPGPGHRSASGVRDFVVTDRQWPGEPMDHSFRRLAAELDAREAKLLG